MEVLRTDLFNNHCDRFHTSLPHHRTSLSLGPSQHTMYTPQITRETPASMTRARRRPKHTPPALGRLQPFPSSESNRNACTAYIWAVRTSYVCAHNAPPRCTRRTSDRNLKAPRFRPCLRVASGEIELKYLCGRLTVDLFICFVERLGWTAPLA